MWHKKWSLVLSVTAVWWREVGCTLPVTLSAVLTVSDFWSIGKHYSCLTPVSEYQLQLGLLSTCVLLSGLYTKVLFTDKILQHNSLYRTKDHHISAVTIIILSQASLFFSHQDGCHLLGSFRLLSEQVSSLSKTLHTLQTQHILFIFLPFLDL